MKAQGSRAIVYSDATSSDEDQLSKLMSDIGYTHTIKPIDSNYLEKLVFDTSYSAFVLLPTDVTRSQTAPLRI